MKKSVLLGALLALPFAAAADGLSYNYIQLDWVADTELDGGGGSVDGDGFDISGVFSINESVYLLGNYEDVSYDGAGADLDLQSIGFGIGVHSNAYTGGIDVFGNLTYENIELEVPGLFKADGNGFGLEIGARTALGASAEGYISYEYNDIDDGEANFFKLGGNFAINPNWAITAEYRTGDYEDLDRDDLRIGLRYNL